MTAKGFVISVQVCRQEEGRPGGSQYSIQADDGRAGMNSRLPQESCRRHRATHSEYDAHEVSLFFSQMYV